MNAPVTRRALLGATAAIGAVGLPVMAAAETVIPASDLDADLFALLDRWHEARLAWDATDAPSAAAKARAKAGYPLRPDALQWRSSDFPRTSYGRAASDAVGDTGRREYSSRGVSWLRRLQSSVQWDGVAEARRQEIVGAHEDWMEARRAVEDATGYTAAVEVETVAAAAFNAAEDDVKLHQPRTLAGLARKALWVADLLAREAGDDDLGEAFARQVAAFGGVIDARPESGCSATFDAAAFLADLEAAGCKVRLEIPGTRFMGEEAPTYFIAPSRGYTIVMAKWGKAIAACPDHVALVTARLAEMHGVNL